jgi:hypothetical protein
MAWKVCELRPTDPVRYLEVTLRTDDKEDIHVTV